MVDQDFAILVGISRYKGNETYRDLSGPSNDVAHIYNWLVDVKGGNVPSENIYKLLTPDELLTPPASSTPAQEKSWTPNFELFKKHYIQIALKKEDGDYFQRKSRLYLYFSGHGFSRNDDMTQKAALYAADAWGRSTPNIPGTVYAEAAKSVALFSEIILIMDCCRDVQRHSPYGAYELDQTERPNSEDVRLFAVYATAKRGRAQERELSGEGGKVFGLLTHALVKALDETSTDVAGRVSGSMLHQYMSMNWEELYTSSTDVAPPPPRTILSDAGEVYFNSRKDLRKQRFTFPTPMPAPIEARLESAVIVTTGSLSDDKVVWGWRSGPMTVAIPFDTNEPPGRRSFTLKLPPIAHTLKVIGPDGAVQRFDFTAGEADAVDL
jgi:hypothetical protein